MGSTRSRNLIIAGVGAACAILVLVLLAVIFWRSEAPARLPTGPSGFRPQARTGGEGIGPSSESGNGASISVYTESSDDGQAQEYLAKAQLVRRQGQVERALQHYQKSAEIAAEPALRSAAILGQAGLLFRQRKHREAIDVLDGALASLEGDWRCQALILKGRCLTYLQRHEEAATLFEEAARNYTETARLDMAQDLLFRAHQAAGTLDDVIMARNRSLEERPDDEGALRELLVVYTRARPNTGKAIEIARRLLNLHPDDIAVLHLLADVALSAQDGKTAVAACERLLELDPANSRMQWQRLLSAYTMIGDSDKALECARKLFDGREPSTSSLSAFAGICARIGKNEEAVRELKRAMELAVSGEEEDAALWALGSLYVRIGNLAQATAIYQELHVNGQSAQTRDKASRVLRGVQARRDNAANTAVNEGNGGGGGVP